MGQLYEFALFKRADDGSWQGIAGGGREHESPRNAAIRETLEETGIKARAAFMQLDTVSSIPINCFKDHHLWGKKLHVIPEYCFGVDAGDEPIQLSREHSEFGWFEIAEAMAKVRYDGNRTALWELNRRLADSGSRTDSAQ
jgi:dATP pyrophosphohydrolase